MAFAFESHVLPLLQDMARHPLSDDYPIKRRMLEICALDDDGQADRLLELMRSDGYVTFEGQQNAEGVWIVLFDVRLTPKALKQLDIWPDDNERALYLLRRLADAFDEVALEIEEAGTADSSSAGRLRAAAQSVRALLRDAGTEIAAKFIANTVAGG